MGYIIKWRNRYSGDTGYVASISEKNRHFNNTYNINDAKRYINKSYAKGTITKLMNYGEGNNNDFEILWDVDINALIIEE